MRGSPPAAKPREKRALLRCLKSYHTLDFRMVRRTWRRRGKCGARRVVRDRGNTQGDFCVKAWHGDGEERWHGDGDEQGKFIVAGETT